MEEKEQMNPVGAKYSHGIHKATASGDAPREYEQPSVRELIHDCECALWANEVNGIDPQLTRVLRSKLANALAQLDSEREPLVEFIKDAAAFIAWAHAHHSDVRKLNTLIAVTLAHDILGLKSGAPCFSPRVSGYAGREKGGGQ
jgi:hypothetical protein